jgi:3-hydroxyisobutyrate dehydrogenase-like beta-hydroxyacid dehydrogenase
MAEKIGILGTGIMGAGIARRLLSRPYKVVVWNRSPEKTHSLVAAGAEHAATPAELARECSIILVVVRDDASARDVVTGSHGSLQTAGKGTLVVNMSTVTPDLSIELSERVQSAGSHYLEAPMTGSKRAAEEGTIGLLVSGEKVLFEEQRPFFAEIAGNVSYLGKVGTSAAFKLANNQVAATILRALGESVMLCEAAGLDRGFVVDALSATATRVCALKKDKLRARDWSTDFSLDLMCKDLDQAQETAAKFRVEMPLMRAVRELYSRAKKSSTAELDFAVIADLAL